MPLKLPAVIAGYRYTNTYVYIIYVDQRYSLRTNDRRRKCFFVKFCSKYPNFPWLETQKMDPLPTEQQIRHLCRICSTDSDPHTFATLYENEELTPIGNTFRDCMQLEVSTINVKIFISMVLMGGFPITFADDIR